MWLLRSCTFLNKRALAVRCAAKTRARSPVTEATLVTTSASPVVYPTDEQETLPSTPPIAK